MAKVTDDTESEVYGRVNLVDALQTLQVNVLPAELMSNGYGSAEEVLGKLSLVAPGVWQLPVHEKEGLVAEYQGLAQGIRDLQVQRERLNTDMGTVALELARLRFVICELGKLMTDRGAFTERLELTDDLAFALYRAAKPLITRQSARELTDKPAPEDVGDHSPFRLGNKQGFEAAFQHGTDVLNQMGFTVVSTDLQLGQFGGTNQQWFVMVFECQPTPVDRVNLPALPKPKMEKERLEEIVKQYVPDGIAVNIKVRVEL